MGVGGVQPKSSDDSSFNMMEASKFELKNGFFSGRKVTVTTSKGDSITLTFNELYKEFEKLSKMESTDKKKLTKLFVQVKLIDAANKTLNPLAKLPNLFFNRAKVIHNTAENISPGKGNASRKLYEFSKKHPDLAVYSKFLEKAILSTGTQKERLKGLVEMFKERPLINKTSYDEWTKICEDLINNTEKVSPEDKELIMSGLEQLTSIVSDRIDTARLKTKPKELEAEAKEFETKAKALRTEAEKLDTEATEIEDSAGVKQESLRAKVTRLNARADELDAKAEVFREAVKMLKEQAAEKDL